MFLVRLTCSTDWKGRPDCGIALIASGNEDAIDAIISKMDEDIEIWQKADVETDRQAHEDDAIPFPPERQKWEIGDERFEMERTDLGAIPMVVRSRLLRGDSLPIVLREFACIDHEDGFRWSASYQLIDEDPEWRCGVKLPPR